MVKILTALGRLLGIYITILFSALIFYFLGHLLWERSSAFDSDKWKNDRSRCRMSVSVLDHIKIGMHAQQVIDLLGPGKTIYYIQGCMLGIKMLLIEYDAADNVTDLEMRYD